MAYRAPSVVGPLDLLLEVAALVVHVGGEARPSQLSQQLYCDRPRDALVAKRDEKRERAFVFDGQLNAQRFQGKQAALHAQPEADTGRRRATAFHHQAVVAPAAAERVLRTQIFAFDLERRFRIIIKAAY